MHVQQRVQTTKDPKGIGCPGPPLPTTPLPPHPAAVQLLQAPVDPLLHVQPPLQLPPVILDGDTRVSFLQPPGATPRPAGPRRSLQLAQDPLAQPLSCHHVLAPSPAPRCAPLPGDQGASYGPGRGRLGAGAWARLGACPTPAALGLSFPACSAKTGRYSGIKSVAVRGLGMGGVPEPLAMPGVCGAPRD